MYISVYLFSYTYLGDSDTDWRESLHDGRSVFWASVKPFDSVYFANGISRSVSVMSIRAKLQLDEGFLKMSLGGSSSGSPL